MKYKGFAVIALTAAATCGGYAQTGPPAPLPGGPMGFGGPFGMGMHESRKVVSGAPYSADVANSQIQTLADGNTITHNTSGHVARDAQGRTYFQETLENGPFATNGPTTVTFISDPVAGYAYVLNSTAKVAMRRVFKAPNGPRPPHHPGQEDGGLHPDLGNRVEADLGQQSVNGVPAQGKSITHTFAAGTIGNSQPLISKSEVWTSPDLQIVVLAKRDDPRMGQSTYTLSNIQRSAPQASLFQVPSDYTVQDAPKFTGHRGGRGIPAEPAQ